MPFYGKTFRMNIFGLKMLKEMFSSRDATVVYVRFSYINFFVHFFFTFYVFCGVESKSVIRIIGARA